ncbi:hypothetical protein A5821_001470 [Enterococcus sp. 7F3_DIV0205]|uniref:AB hydrolase-1 domain-containing protein n=1 Tax=Candidatus Enterococcus palustris TaxID=1834189 RepID=A0AAQ3W7V3_9ENTE|nr:alpha/beta hydrolase [Enterococcus sp. 7F3_DIV0205]OTN85866.1 hypothetical protein A5821_001814 [Enterococcus sp. 7F3_DIV0205]
MEYVFVHGLGQRSSSWEQTISFMSEPEEIRCPDLFALLENKECTYASLYEVFSTYCEAIPEPLNLCGLSLGGILALNYAIDYPEKVDSLVLIGAQYKMPKRLLKFQNMIFQVMPNSTFKKMGMQKQELIQLTGSMSDLDFSSKLKDISCDTLVLIGGKDRANKKAAERLAEKIERAKLRIVQASSHEVNVARPEDLGQELEVFYKSR